MAAPVATRMGLEIARLAPRMSASQQKMVLELIRELAAEEARARQPAA